MDLLKKLDILQVILRANIYNLKQPVSCHFSITNRCPWKCAYCGFPNIHKDEVTTQEAFEIIDSLARMRNKRLHLTGGEPLLRADIGEIIKRAKKHDLYVSIATTGFNLSEIWEKVKDIDIFFLSFDGPEKVHDEQRGEGAYRVFLDAINILSEKDKKFWTTTVLTGKNIDHIDFILSMAKEKNFMSNFHLLYSTNTEKYIRGSFHLNKIRNDLTVSPEKYKAAIAYLRKRKKDDLCNVIGSSDVYLKMLQEWEDLSIVYKKEHSKYYKCWAGKLYCYIDANGDVYPCGNAMGWIKPINCLEHGLEAAFCKPSALSCESCIVACFDELNLMFSLNLNAILNWGDKV